MRNAESLYNEARMISYAIYNIALVNILMIAFQWVFILYQWTLVMQCTNFWILVYLFFHKRVPMSSTFWDSFVLSWVQLQRSCWYLVRRFCVCWEAKGINGTIEPEFEASQHHFHWMVLAWCLKILPIYIKKTKNWKYVSNRKFSISLKNKLKMYHDFLGGNSKIGCSNRVHENR